MTSVPDWVAKSSFFAALVQEGRIAISDSVKDAVVEKAVAKAEEAEKEARIEKEQKVAKKTTTAKKK